MDATVTLGQQGRLVVPAEVRAALHLSPGDRLHVHAADGQIVIQRQTHAVERLRRLGAAIPSSRSLVDELIAERRLSAAG